MTGKPKNRRINLTRGRSSTPPKPEGRESNEIPRGSLVEIRRLIEEADYSSPTELATRLNTDRFPSASGVSWTAALVDSALRRQDMRDLKEKLRENRGEEDTGLGLSTLDVKQAAYDGAKEAISALDLSMPEIPPLKVDTFTVKGAVADAVNTSLKGLVTQLETENQAVADDVAKVIRTTLSEARFGYVRQLSEATSRNVGEINKRIDTTCDSLYEVIEVGLKEHSTKVGDLVEGMVHEVYSRIDTRFDTLETNIVEKLIEKGGIDDALGRIVDERLKTHMDEVMNRFAVMVGNMKRDLTGKKSRVPGKY